MTDPNTSALNQAVMLQVMLDATAADASLSSLENRFEKASDEFAKSAETVFSSVNRAYQNIRAGLIDISKYKDMGLAAAIKENQQIDKYTEQTDILDDYQKTESKFFKQLLKDYDTLIKSIKTKNKQHDIENDSVDTELAAMEALNELVSNLGDKNEENSVSLNEMVRATERMLQFMIQTDAIAEAFVTTNFRAYGTQNQLAQEVRTTSMEYGILLDQATEAMAALANTKVPREELGQYTKVVAQASRFTGQANQALALHAMRFRQVGYGAEDMEKRYNRLGEAMRKYKLSADDLSKVMQDTTWSPAMVDTLWGEGAAAQYEDLRAAMVGLGGQAGITNDQITSIFRNYEDWNNRVLLSQFSPTGAIDSMESYSAALKKLMERAAQDVELSRSMGQGAQVFLKTRAESYGLADEAALQNLATTQKLAKAQGIDITKTEEFATAVSKWKEANGTLTYSLKQLGSTLSAMFGFVLEPVRLAIIEINKALLWLGQQISPVIEKFAKWWEELEKTEGWVGEAAWWIKVLAGGLVALVMIMTMAGGAIISFMTAIGSLKFMVTGLAKVGVGLKVLGGGLWSLGKAAVAFGFALLMAGGGAYLFALGVKTLSDIPYETMKASVIALGLAMIGFAIALGIAVAIIALTGTAISPVLPLIFLLGLALLLLAGAAVLAGYAFKLFGEGIEAAGVGVFNIGRGLKLMAEANNEIGVGSWTAMAVGITAVSWAAWDAAPELAAMAAALQQMDVSTIAALGAAFTSLSVAMAKLSVGEGFKPEKLFEFVLGLRVLVLAAPYVVYAANMLNFAGELLRGVPAAIAGVGESLVALGSRLEEFTTKSAAFENASKSLMRFAISIQRSGMILRSVPSSFGWLSLIRLLAFLEFMSVGFEHVSDRLSKSADDFGNPTAKLVASLTGLAEAVAGFDTVGDRLAANLESLITPLDKYTTQLEAAAERIDAAIMTKMLPAVRAAEEAGIKDALRSEAITSVELMPPKEEDKTQLRMVALLEQQNVLLQSLSELISGLGSEDVGRIKDILEERMKDTSTANVVPNLSSELTGWA